MRNLNISFYLLLALSVSCTKSQPVQPTLPLPVPVSVHLSLGNPTDARPDVATPDNYLMLKDQYALSYNKAKGSPNWVCWELSTDWLGDIDRGDDFRPDPALPADWYRVVPSDYTNSGFDRGHMCPSADRTATAADNSATFLMSNMVPQAPQLNREPWARFEDYCRTLARKGYRLYIVAGVYGSGGEGGNGPATSLKNGVQVPARNYKVIVAVPNGGMAGDVSGTTPVIALDFPNVVSLTDNKSWGGFVTTARQIEKDAGIKLFTALPEKVRAGLLNQRFDPMGVPL